MSQISKTKKARDSEFCYRPNDLNTMTGDYSESVPKLLVCVTCLETPAGIKSDNLEHRRLPDEEYLVK